MYKKILVPLDGSELAECVLPHVETIIKGCSAPEVTFIRVVEPVHLPIGTESDGAAIYSEEDAERSRKAADSLNEVEAKNYLSRIGSKYSQEDFKIHTVVLTGKAADTIADYADKNAADLIVIATHGRSGVSRWMRGSTADKILHSACVAVLMVRAHGCVPGI